MGIKKSLVVKKKLVKAKGKPNTIFDNTTKILKSLLNKERHRSEDKRKIIRNIISRSNQIIVTI